MRYRVMLLGLVVPALLIAAPFDSRRTALAQDTQPERPLPRFRAGANLVRTDVYVSKDGTAVADLKPGDFIVYGHDKPQQVESFERIRARGPYPQGERIDPTAARDMRAKGRWFGMGEVILSPLAAGEYVLELAFAIDGTTRQVAYGFRIVP